MPSSKIKIGLQFIVVALLLVAFSPASLLSAGPEKENWSKHNAERLLRHDGDEPPMLLQAGGPDAYGYFYIDSRDNALNHPTFSWKNITGSGVNIYLEEDDQLRGPFAIGFEFPYYGQIYTQLYVCSNGWIGFGPTTPEYLNRPIPTGDIPNNMLAVFWDDLLPGNGTAYIDTLRDSCVVAWHGFGRHSGPGIYTFEVILTPDGNIHFQYLNLTGTLDSHTIGIENQSGSTGLQYTHNVFSNETGQSIYFGLRPPRYALHDVMPVAFVSPPAGGALGDSIEPTVRFYNCGAFAESFNTRVTIRLGIEEYNQSISISGLPADSSRTITFPEYYPFEAGGYILTAITELGGDLRPSNDSISLTYMAFSQIYRNDFETDSMTFVGDNDWEWGDPSVGPPNTHSGQYLWATILDGNYTVGPLQSSLVSDEILLDTGAVAAFWHWYDTEALYDGGNVKISTDNGITWNLLAPAGGYDGVLSDVFYNPLADEPVFFGASGGWLQETFNLDGYAGEIALFKFDFGSDNSFAAPGWYIDDFEVLGGGPALPGWASGIVRNLGTQDPIPGAIVHTNRQADTCGFDGRYKLELMPGNNLLTAMANYYNSITEDSIYIAAGETTFVDFLLPAPAISIDSTNIDTTVLEGQTVTITRRINNVGSGTLTFDMRVDYLPRMMVSGSEGTSISDNGGGVDDIFQPLDFGDEVFIFDPQTPTSDESCVGVEFDGYNFWVTGRHPSDDLHKLYKFDRNGNLTATYDQNTSSIWGWRDLAWDGEFLYASDENELAKIDPSSGQRVDTLIIPSRIPLPVRGLTYDYYSGHFWGANFTSDIVEFRRSGSIVNSYPNDRRIHGLAWDNASPDGPWLWVFSQDSIPQTLISQFNPRTGAYTDVSFLAIDHNGGEPDLAGGACFTTEWDSTMGVLFCMVMGRTDLNDSQDRVQGYEIAPFTRWLSISPHSGVIPPSGSVDLNITIDFSDTTFRPEQHFGALLTIENNSAAQPIIQLNVGVRSGIGDHEQDGVPRDFALHPNYPNPFNSQTAISFDLPKRANTRLEIFDIQGRRIGSILDAALAAGHHSIIWDAAGMSSGVYFYRLIADGFSNTGRMTLLK
jgi:hypothetical protein